MFRLIINNQLVTRAIENICSMKKTPKALAVFTLAVAIFAMGCCFSSCASSQENMYRTSQSSTKVIKTNYKVRGNNRDNGSTYHSY